jgi:hypothetical protein
MAGIPQTSGVTAHSSAVQVEARYRAQAHARQEFTVKDVGTAALNLIRAVVSTDPAIGQNLDVLA